MQLVYKTRGHRAKHLVYVVVAGSRATQCRKRGSKRIPSRRETAKNHEKRHAIVFFGAVRADRATAVSDIIVRVAADDLRQTQRQRPMGCRSMRGPRFSPYRASGEYRAECLGLFVVCLPSHHGGHMRGFGS